MKGRCRFLRLTAIVLVLLVVTGCTAARGGAPAPSRAQPSVADEVLERVGEFDRADSKEADVGADAALDLARRQDFGRPGEPEVTLVRSKGSVRDIVPTAEGSLLWVFHWGQLGEADVDGIPGADGKPRETVFVRDDSFLLIDASNGDVIAAVRL